MHLLSVPLGKVMYKKFYIQVITKLQYSVPKDCIATLFFIQAACSDRHSQYFETKLVHEH